MSGVTALQRFSSAHPCPICRGFDGAPRGKGERCHGFLSADGEFAHCSREERAGSLPIERNSTTFGHRLTGSCKCGTSHSPSPRLVDKLVKLELVTAYDYLDAEGTVRFQVVRYSPKAFKQRRPDGSGGWIWDLEGVQRVLYNLPAVLKAGEVIVTEGEKDAGLLTGWGLTATTASGGAGKWRQEYAASLRGRGVTILPDADRLGREHALKVAASLLGVADGVKIIELPGAKDVTEWAEKGGTREALMRLAGEAEPLTQQKLEALRSRWFPSDDAPRRPRQLASLDALPGIWTVQGPEQTPVVQGVLGAGEVTMLAGQPGLGKSYVALGLAVAVATGKHFCGRPTAQRPVLILDRENQLHMMRRRLEQLGARDIPAEGLRFWAGWHDFPPEINSPLVAEFAKVGGLIIIDCFIRFFEGTTENDSTEVAQFMKPLLRLSRAGGTVLLIHHSGKATTAQAYRGSSDFLAAVDALFVLSRDGNPADHLTTFRLKTIKTRAGSARDLRGRLASSGFFAETSRPEPGGISADDAPPDPDAIRRKLVEAMTAGGIERLTSDQAVEALDDCRITAAKQPASQLADILQPLNIFPKQLKIHGLKLRGYTLADLTKAGGGTGHSHPMGSPVPGTRYIVDNNVVSPEISGSGTGPEKGARYPPEESPKVTELEPQLPLPSRDDTEADSDEAARYGWEVF